MYSVDKYVKFSFSDLITAFHQLLIRVGIFQLRQQILVQYTPVCFTVVKTYFNLSVPGGFNIL